MIKQSALCPYHVETGFTMNSSQNQCFDMRIIEVSTILVTFAILCRANSLTRCLQDYGTYPVNWNDNVLIFYVTIKNDGDVPITASVKMIECCEQFSKNDTACSHMRLDGSRIKLEKHSITNCTLHYPNTYPYNRKGTCNVNITLNNNQNETVEFLRNITFDTTVRPEDISLLLRESMLSSVKSVKKNFRLCEYPDEDPLDLCEPVNCHMKYRGFRSLFDSDKRQCVHIPVCNGGPKTNSSETVYDPFSNSCIERKKKISIDDIDCILHGTQDDVLSVKTKTERSYYRSHVRCHRGKLDEMNRSCICNDGWESSTNFSVPIVSTVPVHMCTVKVPSKSYYRCPPSLAMLDPKDIFWAFILSIIWYLIVQIIVTCITVNL